MITTIKNVSVYVTDVDRAIRFYADALGLEKRSDARTGPIRWVELAPPHGGTVITLASEGFPIWSPEKVGGFSGLTLEATEPETTFQLLREHHVEFVEEPERTDWGTQAIISDPDGNSIVIVAV
jgi:catechol 2,3-dioxygenase-like lactoylglutathione lyase family enzyme